MATLKREEPDHRRRARRKAFVIWLVLAPLALASYLVWLDLRLFHCWDPASGGELFQLCSLSPLVPAAIIFCAFMLGVLITLDLHRLGRAARQPAEVHVGITSTRLRQVRFKPLRYAADTRTRMVFGFRALEPHHRRHVWAAIAAIMLIMVPIVFGTIWLRHLGMMFR